uniref:Cytochrome P450 7A1-like n=1 Tax=Petromyzon marinus TaxID=7757 RepID=A0AAJ7TYW2_PETMA|nr:cytochrome P450 7A1-like [Petromyzon marinus]
MYRGYTGQMSIMGSGGGWLGGYLRAQGSDAADDQRAERNKKPSGRRWPGLRAPEIWGIIICSCCCYSVTMSPALILVAALLLSLLFVFVRTRKRKDGEPPLENGWIPHLGCALDFGRNPLEFLRLRRKKYGDIFTCKIVGDYFHFIADPFSYNSMTRAGRHLDSKKLQYETAAKVFGYRNMDPKFGFTGEDLHQTFHKTLQGDALDPVTESMMENLREAISNNERVKPNLEWKEDELFSFCSRIMFEAGYLTLFGKEAQTCGVNKILTLSNTFEQFKNFDKIFPTLVAGVPIRLLRRGYKAREILADIHRQGKLKKRENMSALISLRILLNDTVSIYEEVEKAGTHVAMLWASQANSLPAAFWSLYYVLRSPEALKALRSEIQKLIQDTKQSTGLNGKLRLTREEIDSLPILNSSIKEALRLSSASLHFRIAKEDFDLVMDSGEAYHIRKGDGIAVYPPLIHFDPNIYEQPEEFIFNRFLDENGHEKTSFSLGERKIKNYWLPFGSGVAQCPGRYFAVNEVKQFMIVMLTYYDLQLLDPESKVPPPDKTRAGIGIIHPESEVMFKYKLQP